jgi:hypothetical protein
MTTDSIPSRIGSPLYRVLVEYNPFYLISAMCMLFGLFALNHSLDWSPLPRGNLLRLIVTLNVYEAILVALAVFLLQRGVLRDAMWLLLLEAFFLADVGFLNMEVFAIDWKIGLAVNFIVIIVAVVKVAILLRAAGVPLGDGRFAFVIIQLGVLFGVPGLFALIAQRHNDRLGDLVVYGGWWLAGLLPIVYIISAGTLEMFRRTCDGGPPGTRRPGILLARLLVVLPMLSLVAHLCLANWVYKVTFHPANVAPLLLGLAVLIGRADHRVSSLAWRMRLHMLLPAAAVALSMLAPDDALAFHLLGAPWSPLRAALIASALVYLDALRLHGHVDFAAAAIACAVASTMGADAATIGASSLQAAHASSGWAQRIIPRTIGQWGVVSVAMSFALLGVGAAISVFKRPAAAVVVAADEPGG